MSPSYDGEVAVIHPYWCSPPPHTHTNIRYVCKYVNWRRHYIGGTVNVRKFYTLQVLHNNLVDYWCSSSILHIVAYILQILYPTFFSLYSADCASLGSLRSEETIHFLFQPIFYRLGVLNSVDYILKNLYLSFLSPHSADGASITLECTFYTSCALQFNSVQSVTIMSST
jgi:hypothetical protein